MTLKLMLRRGWRLAFSMAALAGTALAGTAAAASAVPSDRGMLPPGHPAVSLPASSFLASCGAGDDGIACNRLALTAIDHARQALEKMGGMSFSLPAYDKLTPGEQLFVAVDLERTERGLPPAVVLSGSLDTIAQAGAQAGRDPAMGSLPGGGRITFAGATWSGGWVNPLGADYAWMYDDGPGGSNLDCRAASPGLCWGHRDILLAGSGGHASCSGGSELAMGTGHAAAADGYRESDTVLLAGVCGATPTDTAFTWAAARKLLHIR